MLISEQHGVRCVNQYTQVKPDKKVFIVISSFFKHIKTEDGLTVGSLRLCTKLF